MKSFKKWLKRSLLFLAGLFIILIVLTLWVSWRAIFPGETTREERLAVFPTRNLPLEKEVTIYWNDYQVPFIEAKTDRDLAFTLGLVHAHLRGGQLAVLKRISQGRTAEMAGPVAVPLDKALRTIGFGMKAKEIVEAMPSETRSWLQAFTDGLNYYQNNVNAKPPEFGLLGIKPEPFTPEDLVTFSRLAGTDVNWIVFVSLLADRNHPQYDQIWERTREVGAKATPSFDEGEALENLRNMLEGLSRSGSNSVALAPRKTASGAAILAGDPHLGISLPNFWLLAGYRSPSYHATGMMIPGLPFIGVGRNPDLAWGGTNMGAASSDLVDVSRLDLSTFSSKETEIKVRFGPDQTYTIRESLYGPVLSDIPLMPKKPGEQFALRWVGHEVSDEITAFLKLNRAKNAEEVRAAFATHAVSGQNILFADKEGNIGMALAVRLPIRDYKRPNQLLADPSDPKSQWQGFRTALDLPMILNPEKGFVASANNLPVETTPTLGYFFMRPARIDRLEEIFNQAEQIDLEKLRDIQKDSYSADAHRLAAYFAYELSNLGFNEKNPEIVEHLKDWTGHYQTNLKAPVILEIFLTHLLEQIYPESSYFLSSWNNVVGYLEQDLAATSEEKRREAFKIAFEATMKEHGRFQTWGEKHRVQARHLLANVPILGRFFVYRDAPTAGSRETLFKASHAIGTEKSVTTYGSQARHISIMDDIDNNHFVLLGGQDGWLGSQNMADQFRLWEEMEYIQLPLNIQKIEKSFGIKMKLGK